MASFFARIFLLFFLCLTLPVFGATITNLDYVPSDLTVGVSNTVTVHFRAASENNITFVKVKFPDAFGVSGATLGSMIGNDSAASLSVGGQELNVSLAASQRLLTTTDVTIVFKNVVNPHSAQGYTVQIWTGNTSYPVFDMGTTLPQSFLAAPMVNVTLANLTALSQVIGGQFLFNASGWDAFGNANATGGFSWASTNTSVALYVSGTGNSSGVFSAAGYGTATITATSLRDPSKSASLAVTVAADSTPPSLSLLSPSLAFYSNASVFFHISSSEALSSLLLNLSKNGSSVASYSLSQFSVPSNYAYQLTVPLNASEGNYSYFLEAKDASNNSANLSGGFAVDLSAPLATNWSVSLASPDQITSEKNASTYRGHHVFFYANVSEPYANLSGFTANLKYANGSLAYALSSPERLSSGLFKWTWFTNTSFLPALYSVDFLLTDMAGNAATYANSLQVELQNASGNLTLALSSDSVCSGEAVQAYGYAYVNGTGLAGATILFEGAAATFSGSAVTSSDGSYSLVKAVSGNGSATVAARIQYTGVQASKTFSFLSPCIASTPTSTPIPTSTPVATSSPTPTPVPTYSGTPTPPPEEHNKSLSENADVFAFFSSDSTRFVLQYRGGEDGFEGDVAYAFPLEYGDYLTGKISFEPEPSLVKEGSIVALWRDVKLGHTEAFTVTVAVSKPLPPALLDQFTEPILTPKQRRSSPTPPPSPLQNQLQDIARRGGFNLAVLVLIIVGVFGGIAFYGKLMQKKVSPENAQKLKEPPKTPPASSAQNPASSWKPLNLPPWNEKKK